MTLNRESKQLQYTYCPYITYFSRSKANQAMKFGQLLEYNMTNIFS